MQPYNCQLLKPYTVSRKLTSTRTTAVAGPRVCGTVYSGYYKTDHPLRTVQATYENTFIEGLEIAAHCDS